MSCNKAFQQRTLSEIAVFKNGRKPPQRKTNGIFPIYGSNGIIGYSDVFNSKQDTIVVGRVGSFCGSLYFSEEKSWVTDNAIIGRAKDGTDPRFLFYLLRHLNLNNQRGGSGQPLLNQGILYSIRVRIPPLHEQVFIGNVLFSLDRKIQLNQQTNKNLEAIGQAIFKRWFVDFEFPNDEGKPYKSSGGEMVESEIGKIPKGWSVLNNISGLCTRIDYGYTQSSRAEEVGPKFLRVMDINKNDWIDWTSVPYCEIEEKDVLKYLLEKKDIVIARMADPGKVAIFESGFPAVFASYLIRIRLKDSRFAYYLYYLMKSSYYQNFIEGAATGSVQMNLNAKSLTSGLSLALPEKELVYTFDSMTENLRTKINHNVSESNSLIKIRDALLPKLMSGKIGAPVAKEKGEAS